MSDVSVYCAVCDQVKCHTDTNTHSLVGCLCETDKECCQVTYDLRLKNFLQAASSLPKLDIWQIETLTVDDTVAADQGVELIEKEFGKLATELKTNPAQRAWTIVAHKSALTSNCSPAPHVHVMFACAEMLTREYTNLSRVVRTSPVPPFKLMGQLLSDDERWLEESSLPIEAFRSLRSRGFICNPVPNDCYNIWDSFASQDGFTGSAEELEEDRLLSQLADDLQTPVPMEQDVC